MIRVAITGESGSGKSHCSRLFQKLGAPIFESDNIANSLMNNNWKLKTELMREFGLVYDQSYNIDNELLRSILFKSNDVTSYRRFNNILQPYILEEYEKFCNNHKKSKYSIFEYDLLQESELNFPIDKTIYVSCNEATRKKRLKLVTETDKFEYNVRILCQYNSDYKKELSDFVIYSNKGDDLDKQINEIISSIYINDLYL